MACFPPLCLVRIRIRQKMAMTAHQNFLVYALKIWLKNFAKLCLIFYLFLLLQLLEFIERSQYTNKKDKI